MEQEIDRVVQAIAIASDPSQASLAQQAINYLDSILQNTSESWRLALTLFVDTDSEGTRKHPAQARFFALRVLDVSFENRCVVLFSRLELRSVASSFDPDSFQIIQQSFLSYIQSEYVYGSAEANATC